MLELWYLELSGTLEDIASMYGGEGGISDSSLERFGFGDMVR